MEQMILTHGIDFPDHPCGVQISPTAIQEDIP